MAALDPSSIQTSRPANNVYTVLLFVALVCVLAATIYVAVFFHQYYGLDTLFSVR